MREEISPKLLDAGFAAVENYGIGGMTSTFFFGPNDRRGIDDVRPAVYESSGLQIHNGNDEWIWRTISNPETLQISSFVDNGNPHGFGLLQREPAGRAAGTGGRHR